MTCPRMSDGANDGQSQRPDRERAAGAWHRQAFTSGNTATSRIAAVLSSTSWGNKVARSSAHQMRGHAAVMKLCRKLSISN
jgi:hypothetical protein